MDDKALIENCYKQMYRGMVEGNGVLMREVFDESFTLTHMTGSKQSGEDFIKAVSSGRMIYHSADHEHMECRIDGDTAEFIGDSRVVAQVYGGSKNTWPLRLTMKMVKKADEWKITEAVASTY